jgi:hypothetical protein
LGDQHQGLVKRQDLLKTALVSFEHTQTPDWELFPGVHLWRSCAMQQLEEEGIGITLTWETDPSRAGWQ